MVRLGVAPPVSGGRRPLLREHTVDRLGKSPRVREWFRSLKDSARSRGLVEGKLEDLLGLLMDRRDAGPTLGDVTITRAQIALYSEREGRWGWSPEAIGRVLVELRELGWLDVVDVDRGDEAGWPLRRYRFRVPDGLADVWFTILDNAGKKARSTRRTTPRHSTPQTNGDFPAVAADDPVAQFLAQDPHDPGSSQPLASSEARLRAAQARRKLSRRPYSPRAGP